MGSAHPVGRHNVFAAIRRAEASRAAFLSGPNSEAVAPHLGADTGTRAEGERGTANTEEESSKTLTVRVEAGSRGQVRRGVMCAAHAAVHAARFFRPVAPN